MLTITTINQFLIVFLLLTPTITHAQKYASDTTLMLMGKQFKLKVVAITSQQANVAVLEGIKEIKRIEALISSYQPTSETSLINANAGIKAVSVSNELLALIIRSNKVSSLTKGAFDITFTPLYKVWKLPHVSAKTQVSGKVYANSRHAKDVKYELTGENNLSEDKHITNDGLYLQTLHGNMQSMPPADTIRYYQNKVGYQKVQLNKGTNSVFLPEKGMAISFGSIGKGYAANKAKQVMQQYGAISGFVDASGDILFWGRPLNAEQWSVGIANPEHKNTFMGWLKVNDMAVVTSGDYEQFITIGGKRYSHIIDPRTGYPVNDSHSVTVICPDAELADALATSVSVLGAVEGIQLINKLKNVECLIVNSEGKIFQSKSLILQRK